MSHSLPNKSGLPNALYRGEQTRQMDAAAQQHGLAGALLMKRAGRAAFARACALWPHNRHWRVLCGKGNNGGDGFVFAALAAQRGHRVQVLTLSDPHNLQGEARAAWLYAQQESVPVLPFDEATAVADDGDWVAVDALLGTGLQGPLSAPYAQAVTWLNHQKVPVLALDVPTGLNADTGAASEPAVRASATLTFIALKAGLFTGRGPALVGQCLFDDLGLPQALLAPWAPVAQRLPPRLPLPDRDADTHKGRLGHVTVIGGDSGYGGAALLAAEAAAFSGAGLVSLATQPEHVTAALVRRPELMVHGVTSGQALLPLLAPGRVLVIGPGLGQGPWAEQLLQRALAAGLPLVLDADALNLLAVGRLSLPESGDRVLTPHPGEAARLLRTQTSAVQNDRLSAARALQARYGGVVVLKGAGTVICDGETTWIADVGNPGLATAGSGDVLSGIIGALLAQGLPPLAAAQSAVGVHGDAADLAIVDTGVRGLQASELLPYVRRLLG